MLTAPAHRPQAPVRVGSLLTALLAASIAFQLNASMLSPALVTMARELNTDDATIGLSQTVFFTLAALFSLFVPRLSDILGRRRVLLAIIAVMLIGSVIAALAVNVEMLFVGRILQGVSGPVVPICLLVLRHEITDAKRYGAMFGLLTAVNGGVAGVDALAGGWLVDRFGFRSIFWVIAVSAAIAIAIVIVWGVESRPSAGRSMDWWSFLPLVVSVGAMLSALNEAGKLGSANWTLVLVYAAVAAAAFVVFWKVGSRITDPLLDPQLLRKRASWTLLLTTLLTMAGVYAVVNGLVVSLAQNDEVGFGMSPDLASVAFLAPYALVGWLVGPFAGRLAPVIGYRALLRFGLVGSSISTLLMAFVGVHSAPVLIGATVLIGIMYSGIANIMANGLGVVLSPASSPGFLPGLNAGAFNLGAGASFAVIPAFQVALAGKGASAGTAGYTGGMLLGTAFILAALAMSFLIPRPASS
ncbi:MFS transporter [Streptomyces sp. NPDC051016]|uniref:uridine transporter UriT n=1 Tax=Streptomyces sp. NPDC051016 TaxID=3365638 RepID=UPI0037AB1CAF